MLGNFKYGRFFILLLLISNRMRFLYKVDETCLIHLIELNDRVKVTKFYALISGTYSISFFCKIN